MELLLKELLGEHNISIDNEKIAKLISYSRIILEENEKYNLTGLKSQEDIVRILIVKSIVPLVSFSVPRGTSFADVGTGSGIPGVVLSIVFPEMNGVLFDANSKKTDFINEVSLTLGIGNIKTVNGRIEDLGRMSDYRNSFDWCFTRAFGPLYYSIEFGLPLLKEKGLLYVYSTHKAEELSLEMKKHIISLGGQLRAKEDHSRYGIIEDGILIAKDKETSDKYPRRFPVVKRESLKMPESKDESY